MTLVFDLLSFASSLQKPKNIGRKRNESIFIVEPAYPYNSQSLLQTYSEKSAGSPSAHISEYEKTTVFLHRDI